MAAMLKTKRVPSKGDTSHPKGKEMSQASSKRLAFTVSSNCQKVVKEDEGFIEVQSDLSRASGVVKGRKVPLSLWEDIATTLSEYLAQKAQVKKPRHGLNVSDIVVKTPLIVEGGKQIYRASGHLDYNSGSVWVAIFSINDFGKIIANHAECIVNLRDGQDGPITTRTSLSTTSNIQTPTRRSPTVATTKKQSPIGDDVSEASKAMAALSIVSKEIGVRIGEMSADSAFDDMGLDSLLSVTITNCLREELGLEVDSSLFATCPTVKQLVDFIDAAGKQMPVSSVSSKPTTARPTSRSISSSTASPSGSDSGSLASTAPTSVASSEQGDDCKEDFSSISMASQICALIAEEAGVDEVKGSTTLLELGLDSMLAVSLTNRFGEYLNKKRIPPSIFAESATCDDVLSALGISH